MPDEMPIPDPIDVSAVYEDLRRLAAAQIAREKPGQTLQATALVHEAYLRLAKNRPAQDWNSRGHLYCAAAEAMRRILIERARQKKSLKGGGAFVRHDVADIEPAINGPDVDVLALDEALEKLEHHDRRQAELVKLRFFAGLTVAEAAELLGVSVSTAENEWVHARCWLQMEMGAIP